MFISSALAQIIVPLLVIHMAMILKDPFRASATH